MKKHISLVCLSLVLLFASFLYLYRLSQIPNGIYVDEATVLYNAISISKTGNDEFGMHYPIVFRLFGSYTPSLFIYVASVAVSILGNSIVVLRGLSIISALASIVIFYFFTKKLNIFANKFSHLTIVFFYSICPWLVFNARLGYEVTFAYTLFFVGLYLLVLALKNPKYIVSAFPILSLGIYTAHTQKYLFFLVSIGYLIFFARNLFNKLNRRYLLQSFILTFIIQIPNIILLFTPAFWVKGSAFTEQGLYTAIRNCVYQLSNYLSPRSIFYQMPDIDLQHTVPTLSIMYSWMVIPFFVGLYVLGKNIRKNAYRFIAFLFIITLVPASLSGRFISIQRAIQFMIPLMIVIGLGIDHLFLQIGNVKKVIITMLFTLISLMSLYRGYFILFPAERSLAWNWGYDKVSQYIADNPDKKFLMDNSKNPRLYIELLYYLDYPPDKYQKEIDPKYRLDYYEALPSDSKYSFNNIEVRSMNWEIDPCIDQVIVGDPLLISGGQAKEHHLSLVNQINDLNGDPLFIFYKTLPKNPCN